MLCCFTQLLPGENKEIPTITSPSPKSHRSSPLSCPLLRQIQLLLQSSVQSSSSIAAPSPSSRPAAVGSVLAAPQTRPPDTPWVSNPTYLLEQPGSWLLGGWCEVRVGASPKVGPRWWGNQDKPREGDGSLRLFPSWRLGLSNKSLLFFPSVWLSPKAGGRAAGTEGLLRCFCAPKAATTAGGVRAPVRTGCEPPAAARAGASSPATPSSPHRAPGASQNKSFKMSSFHFLVFLPAGVPAVRARGTGAAEKLPF